MRRIASLLLIVLALLVVGMACADGGGGSPSTTATATGSPAVTSTPAPHTPTVIDLQPPSSTANLVDRLRPSVVHILSEAATLDVFGQLVPSEGVGTGFIIDEQGHIVTNNHVVVRPNTCDESARSIAVTLADDRKFQASITGRDFRTDLAVLKIDAEGLTPIELGDSSRLRVGEDVVAIGNALDLPGGPTVTKGVVSAKDRLIEEPPPPEGCGVTIPGAIQTDASINPGNSGGPLVNMQGEVIGITTAIIPSAEGIGFAISTATAKPVIDELIQKGRVERGFLGVTIVQITPSLAQDFNLPTEHGIGLRDVQAGSPAADAGLQPGDIIVMLANLDIQTSGDLFRALNEHRAGEAVEVQYYRDSALETTQVTLG